MRNYEKIWITIVVSLLIMIVVNNNASAWIIGEPIVPCGWVNSCIDNVCSYGVGPCRDSNDCAQPPACTQCELLHLVDNLIDFILIAAAPILATFFFILAGVYIMLGGAKPDMLAKGKSMFSGAFIGILIVMLAWLMTNTLITSLLAPAIDVGNYDFQSADWWILHCAQLGLSEEPPGSRPPSPPPPPGGCTDPVCISNVRVTDRTSVSATIIWFTNIKTGGGVNYGLTQGLGSFAPAQGVVGGSTTHTATLNNLQPNTSYCYQVQSAATDITFIARAPIPHGIFTTIGTGVDNGCVAVIIISGEQAAPNRTFATITWTTNALASSEIEYRETGNPVWTLATGPGNTRNHTVLATGLLSNRAYEYRVISVGNSGYRAVGSVRTFTTLP